VFQYLSTSFVGDAAITRIRVLLLDVTGVTWFSAPEGRSNEVRPDLGEGEGTRGVMLCNERNNWLNKLATKIAKVCFAGLLLDHSANFIILVFVFVRH